MARLNSLAQKQSSRGTIHSFEATKKEILSSSTSSCLAVLQAPINQSRIKKQIEATYIRAMFRVAGLKLLGHLSSLDLPKDKRFSYLNWFGSSLRNNTNTLAHFLDGVKGCGEHIAHQLR